MAIETLTVTTTLDQNDGSTTGGLSLRDALMIANANTDNEYIIELQGGSDYFLSLGSSGNNDVESGDLDIYAGANITIRSIGNEPARIDATSIPNGDRVFHVLDGGTLTLEKVIVSGGSGVSYGGGIYVGDATLNLLNTTITDNVAGNGGGIYNGAGNVYIYNSSIISNRASNRASSGGGIYNGITYDIGKNLTIVNSTISNNTANSYGGGIYNERSSNVTIINSTITGNVSNSSSTNVGGGIYNSNYDSNSTIVLRNSIVADNTKDGGTVKSDLSGSGFQGNLYNLVGVLDNVSSNSTIGTGSDIVLGANGSAGLGDLQDNGGFTPTHALLPGSPAIDAGNNSVLPVDAFDIDGDSDTGESIPYDQMGNNRINNGTVDIGAVEFYISASVNNVSISEGNSGEKDLVFEISLNAGANDTVTIDYVTTNGTATADVDYVSTSGTVTFFPGETRKTVTVKIKGDTIIEPDERFFLDLRNPQNVIIGDGRGEGTILNDDFIIPAISINDISLNEGNTGRNDANFTVSLSQATTVPVTIDYSTTNGTATVGSDYLAAQGQITFQPSETSKTIAVGVLGDTDVENTETFLVNLSNPVNGTLDKAIGTGTIINDDFINPNISINDVTVTEGDTETTNVDLTVSLSEPSNQEVRVSYETADDSAMSGTDYIPSQGEIIFAPNQTTQTISIAIIGDTNIEPTEEFVVNLKDAVNGTIVNGSGTVTINDNDFPIPNISINDVDIVEGNSGRKNADFTVSLSQATTVPVTVDYSTANGTATVGNDYLTSQGQIVFQPSETTKTITVEILGDTDLEDAETFVVNLSNPVNGTLDKASGTGTIINDDFINPNISINDVTVTEGDTGTINVDLTVSLSEPSNQEVRVNYETADDSAMSGTDYIPSQGEIIFAPNQTTQTISVAIIGDRNVEPTEEFLINLTNPVNGTIVNGSGTVTINDNDFPIPSISINDVDIVEGNSGRKNANFTVSLSQSTTVPITVDYSTANGTATVGNDYLTSQGQIVFQPSETTKTITVEILGDTDVENTETFLVNLSNPVNGTLNKASGTGTIINDDSSADLLINRFQNTARLGTYLFASEGESGNIRRNFRNFAEEGAAFSVFSQPGDDLIRINRFQNRNVPGTYLYANEQESVNIRRNFPNFIEEGTAFYAYGADANKGSDYYRFQNTQQPGTYIFVGEEEKNNIVANFPQFRLEGIAFEVG